MPAKLNFKTTEDLDYVVIFKNGDDLRQDQLVVQLIQLVDRVRVLMIFFRFPK